MPVTWSEENVAHLLRRAGFAARPKDVKTFKKQGLKKTMSALFKADKKSDKVPKGKGFEDFDDLKTWWLVRMLETKSPLIEKLTLFFHNHFATAFEKVGSIELMHEQNRTIRKSCLGRFHDLVLEMSRDPAMIIWLDNKTNVVGKPNENYARELMELFTTGVLDKNGSANYTELDVQESARAFTGWTIQDGKFAFDPSKHDETDKTFMGQTANFDGGDIVQILAAKPETAQRLAMKLWSFFAYSVDLDDPVLDPLVEAYLDNDTRVKPMLMTMFASEEFYSETAKNAHVKSPVEFAINALKLIGASINVKDGGLTDRIEAMGQEVFNPPSVFGWDEGIGWVGTSGMLERARAVDDVTSVREKDAFVSFDPEKLLGSKKKYKKWDAAQTVSQLLAQLGPLEVSAGARAALEFYLKADSSGSEGEFSLDDETIDRKIRGFLAVAMALPEFQVH